MDIRARSFLSFVKEQRDCEDAIIAGGAARDEFLGVTPKDYDIFIPRSGFYYLLDKIEKSGKMKTPVSISNGEYIPDNKGLTDVRDMEYEGIKIQLMSMSYTPSLKGDEFAQKVVEDFDYNICKIWYDGSIILRDTQEFLDDVNHRTMTLSKLRSLDALPKAVDRFNRINLHLGGRYRFQCPMLRLENSTETVVKEESKLYSSRGGSWRSINPFTEDLIPEQTVNDEEPREVLFDGAQIVEVWDQVPTPPMQQPNRANINNTIQFFLNNNT